MRQEVLEADLTSREPSIVLPPNRPDVVFHLTRTPDRRSHENVEGRMLGVAGQTSEYILLDKLCGVVRLGCLRLDHETPGPAAENDVGDDSSLWCFQAPRGGSALGILYAAECGPVMCRHIPRRPWFERDAVVVQEGLCRETIELCELGEKRSSCARAVAESAEHVAGENIFVDMAVVPDQTAGNGNEPLAIHRTRPAIGTHRLSGSESSLLVASRCASPAHRSAKESALDEGRNRL